LRYSNLVKHQEKQRGEVNFPLRTSLGKSRRAVPEVWFRIVHIAVEHVKGSLELREQAIEVAFGFDGAFENGNIGVLPRQVPADRVVCAVPPPQYPPRPPEPPRPLYGPRTLPVVKTIHKAVTWRQELDSGTVATQAAIARREGVTRARVPQIMMLLRLAPDIQDRVLALPATEDRPILSERMLRPITFLDDAVRQQAVFSEMVAASSSR